MAESRRARPGNLPDVACIMFSHERASGIEPDDGHILRGGKQVSLKINLSQVLD